MNRVHAQEGYALATAIIVISIMLTVGLASLALVDSETNSSNRVRAHESRLNLTEGVVAAEVFQMSRSWPDTVAEQYPVSCTQASAVGQCPTPAQLEAQFSGPDFKPGSMKWTVQVRDDVAGATAEYYSDATVLNNPRYDANGNGEMWVRAQGQLGTKTRTVVARIGVESRSLKPPAAPLVAGSFNTGNSGGSKVIVETSNGAYGVVRCDTGADVTDHNNDCIDYTAGQVSPTNMVKSDPSAGPAFAADAQEALKQLAKDNGTYYAGCPANPSGAVVWVERGDCDYGGNLTVNGTTKRGIFIVANGTLSLSGNVQWWGVIYALNQQNCGPSTTGCLSYKGYGDNVVTVTGTPTVHGAILVDGGGRIGLGNSGGAGQCAGCLPTLMYDPSVVEDLKVAGTAGIVQNTWRELISG